MGSSGVDCNDECHQTASHRLIALCHLVGGEYTIANRQSHTQAVISSSHNQMKSIFVYVMEESTTTVTDAKVVYRILLLQYGEGQPLQQES